MSNASLVERRGIISSDKPCDTWDEARDELDDLNEEAEMTHEELLKKYNINATEYNQQKDEIAQVFLSELVKMQQAEMSESESEEGDEINKKRLEKLEKRE